MRKLTALVTVLAIASATACHTQPGQIIKNDAIDCAHADLGQTVADMGLSLLMAVATILFQGGSNWQYDLNQLGAKYGPDVISCAAKIAGDLFKMPQEGSGSAAPGTAAGIETPYQRAVEFNRGKSFK